MTRICFVAMAFFVTTVSRGEVATTVADAAFRRVMEVCHPLKPIENCLALLNAMRHDDAYRDPAVQFGISEALMGSSGGRNELLEIAYEIMTELMEAYPSDTDYPIQRAFTLFAMNKLAGICEAEEADLPATLATQLNSYYESKQIKHDIINFSIKSFDRGILEREKISHILWIAERTLKFIENYGTEQQSADFLIHAKHEIPWDDWRQVEWEKVVDTMQQPTAASAAYVLYTYCQSTMITLDDGEFCNKAIALAVDTLPQHVIDDEKMQTTVDWIGPALERETPSKIGDAPNLLKKLVNEERHGAK